MRFISSKTSRSLSFEDIPCGALVELRTSFLKDDDTFFYAIKCKSLDMDDYFYMDIEDGILYSDIDSYPIIRIISAKIVEEDD